MKWTLRTLVVPEAVLGEKHWSNTYFVKSELSRLCVTSNSEDDCIEFVAVCRAITVLGVNTNFTVRFTLKRIGKPYAAYAK